MRELSVSCEASMKLHYPIGFLSIIIFDIIHQRLVLGKIGVMTETLE